MRHNLNTMQLYKFVSYSVNSECVKGEVLNNRVLFFGLFLLFVILAGIILITDSMDEQTNNDLNLKVLNIALSPTHDPDQLLENSKPLVFYLEKELNAKVNIIHVTDYSSVVQALGSQHVDVAFMPGLPTVFAIKTADSRPICIEVQRGKTNYYSHIYVRKDSGLNTLEDLKGRSIAFTDYVSSSGFLYPLSRFYEEGLIDKGENFDKYFGKVRWLGGYETALTSMFNGQVDASCGSEHAPLWYLDEEQKKEIKLLDKSGPLPTHSLVVRNSLGEEIITKIQQVFMGLNNPENKAILKDLYHADALEEANVSTYDTVYQKAITTGLFDDVFATADE